MSGVQPADASDESLPAEVLDYAAMLDELAQSVRNPRFCEQKADAAKAWMLEHGDALARQRGQVSELELAPDLRAKAWVRHLEPAIASLAGSALECAADPAAQARLRDALESR